MAFRPHCSSLHRDYIGRGQLKTVYDSLSSQPVIDYAYLPDGKVDHADYRNGVRCTYGYDGRGMIKSVDHSRAGSQDLSRRDYTRDSRDRIISFKKGTSGYNPMENGRGDRFRYDDEGQLVEAWYNAADPANSGAGNNRYDGFSYDELGNRGQNNYVASRGLTSFYRRDTRLNEYASWSPSPFWYDGGGVMGQDGWITLPVNSLNQPIWAWAPAYAGTSNLMWFGYDPLGRCVKRWVSASGSEATNPATYFYYEGWNMIQEGPSYNSASRNYVHGARVDEVVKQITPGNWWERYFQYDARGHCTLQTDASGNINEQYEYDAFGYPYFFDGAGNPATVNGQPGSPFGNRFLFTGREWLSDLKLYDFRNRMYQPELGRFLQPDPKEFGAGDYNLYRYCHNDPINKSDPTGLDDTFVKAEVQKRVMELGSNIGRWVTVGTLTANFAGTSWQSAAYSGARMAAVMAHNTAQEHYGVVVHQANSSKYYATSPMPSDLKGQFYGGHAQASALGDLRVLGYKTAAGYWSVAGHMDLGGGWPKHADGTTDEDVLKAGHMNAVLANPGMKGSAHAYDITYKEHNGEPDQP